MMSAVTCTPVRREVIEKYGEGNPMFEKLLEIAFNNRLGKLAAIPSFEVWSKSDTDVGAPTLVRIKLDICNDKPYIV